MIYISLPSSPMEEIIVQINYREPTIYGDYSDALYIPYSEYQKMSTAKREAWKATKKQERIDNYLAYRQNLIDNPPPIDYSTIDEDGN